MSDSSNKSNEYRTSTIATASTVIAAIMGALGVIIAALLGSPLGIQYILRFFYAIPVWGTFLILLISGIVLYWIRSRFRMIYGIAEYVVGLATAINVFLPLHFDYSQLKPLAMLQILGGAYIMVRGLDNFGISIKGKWLESYWERIFGKR